MSSFNLIDEKWIPVRFPDGTYAELGLKDTLLRSRAIAAIEDPSPLVVAALHRFLLAVLYRALEGPTDINQAKALFRDGLPAAKISAYLEKWRDRFWLFDERYPFGQISAFEPRIWRAWTVIATEHNADNAKVLFDHIDVANAGSISAGNAACWLLATQTFSVSAGKSELSHTGTAPSATAAMVLPLGRDLHDTLLLALVPQNREVTVGDFPIWERSPESVERLREGPERIASGLADRYTWRTRTIHFKPNERQIERIGFASGVGISPEVQTDPMLGYRIDEKNGKLPVQFRDRGIWRDFDSLLPDDSHLAPLVIENAAALARSDNDRFPHTLMVLGQANNKAKIEYWRMERFTLPIIKTRQREVRAEVKALLVDAESAQKPLWAACCSFARDILSRGERKPAAKDINSFVQQMAVISNYWSTLETSFHKILQEYALEQDSENIRYQWLSFIRESLLGAWEQHRISVSTGDVWSIRALVKAEGLIRQKLRELNNELRKLEPKKEEA